MEILRKSYELRESSIGCQPPCMMGEWLCYLLVINNGLIQGWEMGDFALLYCVVLENLCWRFLEFRRSKS